MSRRQRKMYIGHVRLSAVCVCVCPLLHAHITAGTPM